jgi:S1-C subfamily serine protease
MRTDFVEDLSMNPIRHRMLVPTVICAALAAVLSLVSSPGRADLPPELKAAEEKRIEVVKKVQPAVVAVFNAGGQGGGSGVLIDEDGYALTNFHVVEGAGITMQCGLSDGVLYDAILVGLDKVGDVAMIKLLPKKEGQKFPFAKMGDSEKVKAGDWSFAMGNPFLLATDFTPTVTFGLVSGVNRYQYPSGLLLEYTACIQIDTSINPGNSGGPLFNLDGELIGINGRGSFEKRGRVNSGVGYAISINQIKNFEGQLRAGIDTDHASLGATIITEEEEGKVPRLIVERIKVDSDAGRRGLDAGDEIKEFAGVAPGTVNEYKNILGMFPRGWRVPMRFEHSDDKTKKAVTHDVLVRLEGVQRRELPGQGSGSGDKPPPGQPPKINPNSPAAKLYVAKPGFANYYFNKQLRDQLIKDFQGHGNFTELKGKWTFSGQAKLGDARAGQPFQVDLDGDNLLIDLDRIPSKLDVTKDISAKKIIDTPTDSGGLLMALYQYRNLLVLPDKDTTFNTDFSHGGTEPFYIDGNVKQKIDANVVRTTSGPIMAKWYFAKDDKKAADAGLKPNMLAGFEITVDPDMDPCEVYLSDYRAVNGKMFPHKMSVVFGNKRYGTLTVEKVDLK